MVAPILSEGAVTIAGGSCHSSSASATTTISADQGSSSNCANSTSPSSQSSSSSAGGGFHHHHHHQQQPSHQLQLQPLPQPPATPLHQRHSVVEPDSPDSLISPPSSPEEAQQATAAKAAAAAAEERSRNAANEEPAAPAVPAAPPAPAPPTPALIAGAYSQKSPLIVTTPTVVSVGGACPNGSPSAVSVQKPRGLSNNGNTCFFNACMQCLSQTPYLGSIFTDEVVHIPGGEFTVNTAATKTATSSSTSTSPSAANQTTNSTTATTAAVDAAGLSTTVTKRLPKVRIEYSVAVDGLLQSFKNLMDDMQKSGGVINPHQFFNKFTDLHSQFSGGDQHDSHELLRHLLDSVLIAERKIYRAQLMQQLFGHKIFNKLTAPQREELEFYAVQAKERFLIRRLFQGNLESTLRCETCGHSSPNMETFLDISLPVVTVPVAATLANAQSPSLQRSPSRQSPVSSPGSNSSPPPLADAPVPAATADADADEPAAPLVTIKDNRYAKSPTQAAASEQPKLTKRQQKRMAKEMGRKVAAAALVTGSGRDRRSNASEAVDREVAAAEKDAADVEKGEREERPEKCEKSDEKCDETACCGATSFGNFRLSKAAAISLLLRRHGITCNGDDGDHRRHRSAGDPSADPGATIGAPYRTRPDECSVQSCLNAFIAAELLSGSNQVTCSECTRRSHLGQPPPPPTAGDKQQPSRPSVKRDATKKFLISSLPAVLILHLKRFQISYRHRVQKIHQEVAFPLVLDMGPFCAASPQLGVSQFRTVDAKQRSIWYALYGVVVHQGQMGGGHYIAYVKMRKALGAEDRRWRFVSTRLQELEVEERRRRRRRRSNSKAEADENGNGEVHSEASGEEEDSASYDSDDSLNAAQQKQRRRAERERQEAAEQLAAEEQQVRAPEGLWYCVSDTRVSQVPEEAVLKAQAYLLFYERIF